MFPVVDRFMGVRLDCDLAWLKPGHTEVVETERRLRCEESYGFVHALWWLWLADGRSFVSVPPGAGEAVRALVDQVRSAEELHDPALVDRLRPAVDAALARQGRPGCGRGGPGLAFACAGAHLRRPAHGDCRRLVGADLPVAEGLSLPTHCFLGGIVYGVVADGCVVAVAYAHRTRLMEGQLADLGVETALGYRRRGYAQTAVAAVVAEVVAHGGEALYACSPTNLASIATARSVGFLPYADRLEITAQAQPAEGDTDG